MAEKILKSTETQVFEGEGIRDVPVAIRGLPGQEANLLELRNSANVVVASVSATGAINGAGGIAGPTIGHGLTQVGNQLSLTTPVAPTDLGSGGPSGSKVLYGDGVYRVPPPLSYTHDQSTPSATWTVNHGLGFFPGGVTVIDTLGRIVEGDVTYVNANTLTLTFSASFSGTAYIS